MTDDALIRDLPAEGTVLTDGAWGTELQKRGLAAGEIPDFLNLHHPDRVEAVAANAGLPAFDQGEVVYPFDPRQFAAYLPALLEAGAKFVGGCCGTSLDYIAALREKLGEPH